LIVIAHRIRTILDADQIVVLSDGHLLERGSPSELLNSKSHFATMVDASNIDMNDLPMEEILGSIVEDDDDV